MAEKEYIEKWETLRNMKMDVAPPFKVVQEMPPADVVEVVRCKDCAKHGLYICPICYIEKQTLRFVNHDPNFYCSYGERKGESNA